MKLKDKFNLSHVAGFFVGVVVTVIFNWIVFKDPKRVTAPGVAALVAMCTFTLALWSAAQVKKWINSKINEKAFKRTEEFLDSYILLMLNIAKIYSIAKILKKKNIQQLESDKSIIRNINDFAPGYLTSILTLTLHKTTFRNWGIVFKHGKAYKKIMGRLAKITPAVRKLNDLASDFNTSTTQQDDIEKMKALSLIIIQYVDSIYYSGDGIMKKKYSEIFDFTITLPLKRVD